MPLLSWCLISMPGCKSQSCVIGPGVGWGSLTSLVTPMTRCQDPDQLWCHTTLSLSLVVSAHWRRPWCQDRGDVDYTLVTTPSSSCAQPAHLTSASILASTDSGAPAHGPLWPHASWTSLKLSTVVHSPRIEWSTQVRLFQFNIFRPKD